TNGRSKSDLPHLPCARVVHTVGHCYRPRFRWLGWHERRRASCAETSQSTRASRFITRLSPERLVLRTVCHRENLLKLQRYVYYRPGPCGSRGGRVLTLPTNSAAKI